MILESLALQNFRNYQLQTFHFSPQFTLILAPNASGKSNLLEAIHFISVGESFRAGKIDDVIRVDSEYGRIKGKVRHRHPRGESEALRKTESHVSFRAKSRNLNPEIFNNTDLSTSVEMTNTSTDEVYELELLLSRGLVAGKRTQKKIFSLNGVRKRLNSLTGILPTVSFIPEDLRLITGSPSRRRQFLDTLLSQLDQNYTSSLKIYDQTLRRRNRLLQQIREGEAPRTTLSYYDKSLLKNGEYVQTARRKLLEEINTLDFPLHIQVDYNLSLISPARLSQYSNQEIAAGHTLVGPHKDDITVNFSISNHQFPLSTHGSRGQQRMGVLWLKLGAFELLKNKYQSPPVLLLDDIFSELDEANRQRVMELAASTQTILTSAEQSVIEDLQLTDSSIIRL